MTSFLFKMMQLGLPFILNLAEYLPLSKPFSLISVNGFTFASRGGLNPVPEVCN